MSADMTSDQLAEQAGSTIGHRLLDEMLKAKSQADAHRMLCDAINDLNHPAAVAGFCCSIVNVLEVGLKCLPRMTEQDVRDWGQA